MIYPFIFPQQRPGTNWVLEVSGGIGRFESGSGGFSSYGCFSFPGRGSFSFPTVFVLFCFVVVVVVLLLLLLLLLLLVFSLSSCCSCWECGCERTQP